MSCNNGHIIKGPHTNTENTLNENQDRTSYYNGFNSVNVNSGDHIHCN
jgi:hypothetical protein